MKLEFSSQNLFNKLTNSSPASHCLFILKSEPKAVLSLRIRLLHFFIVSSDSFFSVISFNKLIYLYKKVVLFKF